ncbi:LysR family transcriptional regulator, partial [Streptomyces sp. NPDC047097]|uniref:LysR family transcriptional regulator n=1 Tax=Streptomyces sp. NPDC047097 TaxID=3155260 RepID=UPI0033E2353E
MHHDLHVSRLRSLLTIVDLGGFRKAAEALCLTQSAVSQQIRQLNLLIGTPVFTSTGSNLQLSDAGAELLGYARRIVALNDETVSRLVAPRGQQHLTLGVADQLADVLPGMLELLARRVPHARISVRTGQSDSLCEQLSARALQSALLLGCDRPGRSYETRELGRLPLTWFGRPSHGPGD